jgi:hypothetical protein
LSYCCIIPGQKDVFFTALRYGSSWIKILILVWWSICMCTVASQVKSFILVWWSMCKNLPTPVVEEKLAKCWHPYLSVFQLCPAPEIEIRSFLQP